MPAYANRSGKSGVVSYQTGADWISVTFRGGRTYTYSYAITGQGHVDVMKRLAASGSGLATFISRNRNSLAFV